MWPPGSKPRIHARRLPEIRSVHTLSGPPAGFRAVAWGLLLAPATLQQAYAMLPHSGTLLLEGEGYILAAFFGLMIPLTILRRPAESDAAPKHGYGWAVLLNLKGSVLVALVLAISAIYEATEVIQMLKSSGEV